jgi:hypothetical protein
MISQIFLFRRGFVDIVVSIIYVFRRIVFIKAIPEKKIIEGYNQPSVAQRFISFNEVECEILAWIL